MILLWESCVMKDYSHVKMKVEAEKEEEIKKIETLKEKISSDFDEQLPKMAQDFCKFVSTSIENKVERFYKNGKKDEEIKKAGFLPFSNLYTCEFELSFIELRLHTEDICTDEMKEGKFILERNHNEYYEMPNEKKLSEFISEVNKILSEDEIKVVEKQIKKGYNKSSKGYYDYPTYRVQVSAKMKL